MEIDGEALVTGASRGLGRAVAIALADRGFDVVATMRDPDHGANLVRTGGRRRGAIRVHALDITHPGSFEFSPDLRVLVNNAAVRRAYLAVEDTSLEEWRSIFETNVFGVAEITRRAIPVLRAAGTGVICNVTTSAMFVPKPFFGTYSGSKAALSAITDALRAELVGFGIRVLEITPGPLDTEMLATSTLHRPPDAAANPIYRSLAERAFPAGRTAQVASPEAAAAAIVASILDDDGPLRQGCDPTSVAALEAWRTSSDEDRWARVAATFAPGHR